LIYKMGQPLLRGFSCISVHTFGLIRSEPPITIKLRSMTGLASKSLAQHGANKTLNDQLLQLLPTAGNFFIKGGET